MFPIFVYFANYNLSNTFYGCRYSAPLKGELASVCEAEGFVPFITY